MCAAITINAEMDWISVCGNIAKKILKKKKKGRHRGTKISDETQNETLIYTLKIIQVRTRIRRDAAQTLFKKSEEKEEEYRL